MLSRRELLVRTGQTCLFAGCGSFLNVLPTSLRAGSVRCINVINFIREIEPRFKMDMMLPVRSQMEVILANQLPATWLLQFDALVSGPFVPFLKEHMAKDHEVGFWFEMNEKLVKAAGVNWRGRPGYEWDFQPPVAFTIGYTPEERVKLADTAMKRFKEIWGHYPSSVASWNLDSFTIDHLEQHYGIDAFAVCRDQVATDGFTIWGAPIAGYYPSKQNCWSPALHKENQISAPVFRMLGQDPVYYYSTRFHIGNKQIGEPDTMEPVWHSGRSETFVHRFLEMIAQSPTLGFAYAQLGQENTFPWDQQKEAYPKQMAALAELRKSGAVHVETMGESGRRFKQAFSTTPAQAQVMLNDPFGNTPPEKSIWYQSRFYRADLHFRDDLPFLRDITVYSDRNPQPFLKQATRDDNVEQRMPAVLDGFHWADNSKHPGAGGFFSIEGKRVRLTGDPKVREEGNSLIAELPVGAELLTVRFDEQRILVTSGHGAVGISFEWDPSKSAMVAAGQDSVHYRWQGFDYHVKTPDAQITVDQSGWSVQGKAVSLELNQDGSGGRRG